MTDRLTPAMLLPPIVLCGAMLLGGFLCCRIAGVQMGGLFLPYLTTAWAVTFLCLLIYIFIEVARMAARRAQYPVAELGRSIALRLPLLILPALIAPLFLCGFTATKTAMPFLVGYSWDGFWAAADRLIFREDVWRLTHQLFPPWTTPVWEWFYTVAWGLGFVFCKGFVALYASPRRVGVFFTAMLLTWFLGGFLGAYVFASAGPVFIQLADPQLVPRFSALQDALAAGLDEHSAVRLTQAYLSSIVYSHRAVFGGGISAMPSMHIGAVSIMVLAARRTRWMIPALVLWAAIFIGSAYFGYHYWLDGIVAAAIAWCCWVAAERIYAPKAARTSQMLPQLT